MLRSLRLSAAAIFAVGFFFSSIQLASAETYLSRLLKDSKYCWQRERVGYFYNTGEIEGPAVWRAIRAMGADGIPR
jgi:hypothetical protein